MSGQRRTTRERERESSMERPESPEAFPKAHWFFERVSAAPHVRPKPLQSPGFSVGAEKKGIEKKRERRRARAGRGCARNGWKRDICCGADGWDFTSLAARCILDFWSDGGPWIHIVDIMNAIIHVITPSGLRQAEKCLKRLFWWMRSVIKPCLSACGVVQNVKRVRAHVWFWVQYT